MLTMDSSRLTEIKYNVTPARKYHLIERVQDLEGLGIARGIGENTWIQMDGKTILLLQSLDGLPENLESLQIDYLVAGKKIQKKLPELLLGLQFEKLILDASISQADIDKIMQEKGQKSMKIHSIQKDGAFVIRI